MQPSAEDMDRVEVLGVVLQHIHDVGDDLKRFIVILIVVNSLVVGGLAAIAMFGLTRDSEFEKTRAVSVHNQDEIKCILKQLGPKTTPAEAIDKCEKQPNG